ncbi:MAG: energy-coupling factor ABC transporter permease [Planctomycetota bacterium]|nr:MAG: energy-coupling factor ABC transporter permease [Planctomycetota bacterium]
MFRLKKSSAGVQLGTTAIIAVAGVLYVARPAFAMHIAEGILPGRWAGVWGVVVLPFLYFGTRRIQAAARRSPRFKTFLALVGAAVFLISCMPIPVPVVGSCSHPCGTGLAAILVGPGPAVVLAMIALFFQAMFLAHGGLTTLGANILTMGVCGAFAGYAVFRIAQRCRMPDSVAAFLAGVVSDWATYAATALVLAVSLRGDSAWLPMFWAVLVAFIPTQLPLGILEGFLSAGAYAFVSARSPELLESAWVPGEAA